MATIVQMQAAPDPSRAGRLRSASLRAALAYRMTAALLRVVPARPSTVVYSPTVGEGNAVEVVRHLVGAVPGPVCWLLDLPAAPSSVAGLLAEHEAAPALPSVRRRRSLRGLWAFLRADLVFFTHQLYGCPRPTGKRVYVNLWHGDGPKTTVHGALARRGIPADLLVSGTTLWGREKARSFGLQSGQLIVTGNPRSDQLWRPADDAALARLSLDPARPIVVWAPTYRRAQAAAGLAWTDSESANVFQQVWRREPGLADQLAGLGVQLIAKPHPLDAESLDLPGVRVVTDAELLDQHVCFYELLGRAAVLLTDYSSVWSDYLPLDRPIGFFCPDLEAYRTGRGFSVTSFEDSLPGELLVTGADLAAFVRRCLDGRDDARQLRSGVAARLGVNLQPGATHRLLELVRARQRARACGAPTRPDAVGQSHPRTAPASCRWGPEEGG